MTYYAYSVEKIREAINVRFPEAQQDESAVERDMPSYILWMLDQIQSMDKKSISAAVKAARWIGWVYAICETQLELWENKTSRDIAREDKNQGNDLPNMNP